MGINNVILAGYVGTEPKVVVGKSDFKIARVSIGTTTYRGGKSVTDWHNVEAFGSAANYIERYVNKGDYVVVTGFLSMSTFKKDGVDKHYYNVKVSAIEKPRVKDVESDPGEDYESDIGKTEVDMPY